jgi:ABC-type oligopeptide transport system ATPase subunit
MIQAHDLSKNFSVGGGLFGRPDYVHAVDSVTFSVERGETFGLVGESGCGKSTLGRLLIRLIEPTGGVVRFDGIDLTKASTSEMRSMRRRMQTVHQNPYAAIDPRMRARDVVARAVEMGLDILDPVQISADGMEPEYLKSEFGDRPYPGLYGKGGKSQIHYHFGRYLRRSGGLHY